MFSKDNTRGYTQKQLNALNDELAIRLIGIPPGTDEFYQAEKEFHDEVSRRTTQHKCAVCDQAVDINNLHTDSLEPQGEYREDWSIEHVGCQQDLTSEEREHLLPEELKQAWVTHR